MVTHMKTTVEIADDLLARLKRQARREGKTLRQLLDEALRARLAAPTTPPFRLRKRAFKGDGRQPGIADGKWQSVRDLIYRLG
jgi:hypothetical protein